MPRTKVYFIRTTAPTGVRVDQAEHITQVTAVVVAANQKEAAERLGVTVHSLRTWGGDYGPDQGGLLPDAARSRPGHVAYFPLDPRPGDVPVWAPTVPEEGARLVSARLRDAPGTGEDWHSQLGTMLAEEEDRAAALRSEADRRREELGLPPSRPREGSVPVTHDPTREHPYTVVAAMDQERAEWFVAAVLEGHPVVHYEEDGVGVVRHVMVAEELDVADVAEAVVLGLSR